MRGHRVELLTGVGCAAFGAAVTMPASGGTLTVIAASVLGGSLGLTLGHPRLAWLVATAALLVTARDGELPIAAYALVVGHGFCAGRWEGRWAAVLAALALVTASEIAVLVDHGSAIPFLFIAPAACAGGRALRDREEVVRRLVQSARELDEERDAHTQLSVRYERVKIAAELHDIVAHAISVIVVQASAGQRLVSVDSELTAETFESIAGAAQRAEQDIGRLAELLASEKTTSPTPDLSLLEELITRAAGSGLDVTLRFEGEHAHLSAALSQLAYRIVQEGITNALRHASGAPVAVLVGGDPTALIVTVTNAHAASRPELAGIGTGQGLAGLRERVIAHGGTLQAGARPDGYWRLAVELPTLNRATR